MSRSSLERERLIHMQKMNQPPAANPQPPPPPSGVPMAAYYPAYGYPPMYQGYYMDPTYAAYAAHYADPNAAMATTSGVPQEPYVESRTDLVPLHGNKTNFNINSMLFNNITSSDYFLALDQLPTFHDVIGNNSLFYVINSIYVIYQRK